MLGLPSLNDIKASFFGGASAATSHGGGGSTGQAQYFTEQANNQMGASSPAPAQAPAPAPAKAPIVSAPDPYARWGGKAAYDAARNNIGVTQGSYEQGARQGLTDVGNTYDNRTRTFVNELETGQGDINRGLSSNQLNLRTSMANIIRGIQAGIRSGGVALAGMNASDSGASDALARAYAKVGNSQTGEVRGEAATTAEELQRQQGQLNQKKNEGIADLNTYKTTETGRVRGDLGSKLDVLDAQAGSQGLGGMVDRNIVDRVLNDALARLAQIDQGRDQRLSGIQQWTPEQIMAEALRLESLGQSGTPFQFSGADVNYGGQSPDVTGAPLAQLPIYAKGKDQLAVVPRREDTQLL